MLYLKSRNSTVQTAALLGTYVPRRCGIATFTKDLRDAIAEELGQTQTTALAIDDTLDGYDYPDEVRFQLHQHNQTEYITAADLLNFNQIDVAMIQHEYGIYGGSDGSHVLDLARALRMPIITTLHTVLPDPSPGQRRVLRELMRLSDRVVTMSHSASDILCRVYQAAPEKIAFIPHGIPDVPFVDPHFFADQFNAEGKRVLLTFGLLSPGKGIEVAIRAMARVVHKHPNILYIVLGATHPHVLRREGNAYRNQLERLVDELKLENNVAFHNRFVSFEELCNYIGVAEVYISPYPNRQQITSGTLAYAMGAGKAVVSTPYLYAEEMLADGRGRLFPFGDSEKLADEIIRLLDDDAEQHAVRKRAYLHCRPMVWKEVARSYLRLGNEVLVERSKTPKAIMFHRAEITEVSATPDVNLSHLDRMTDDCGMLQHATYSIPDRHHGYCTDDNARALIAALLYYDLTKDETILPLADRYLSFVHASFNEKERRFRNFLSYDRRWLEEVGSEDVHGRAIWSLGVAVHLAPTNAVLGLSIQLLKDAMPTMESLQSPRAWAFCLVGIQKYLTRFSGDTQARRIRQHLAMKLYGLFEVFGTQNWPWLEETLTYANARLTHALLLAGQGMGDEKITQQGLKSLEWLVNLQILENSRVSLIGNDGWYSKSGGRARFDQQPIEAMSLIEACAEAYRITKLPVWEDRARSFLDWFIGNNDTHSNLYDFETGGCRDGLAPGGPNLNQGAESTLAWLISLFTIMDLNRAQSIVEETNSGPGTPVGVLVQTKKDEP